MKDNMHFDTIIIGGGPAGSSCALWLKLQGFNPCIIEERSVLGGLQNDSPYINAWIAAIPNLTGYEVAANIHESIRVSNVHHFLNSRAHHIKKQPDHFVITFEHKTQGLAEAIAPFVVIASGVKPITGGFYTTDHLLIGPGKQIADYDFKDKRVAILGGGDNAFENYAFIQSKGAASVKIFARTIRARQQFINQTPAADVYLGQYTVNAPLGTVAMTGNSHDVMAYDVIIVLYGWAPNLSFLGDCKVAIDSAGFITTDLVTTATSIDGIYAIGEVAHRFHPCVVTAMADGVVAAKVLQRALEK